MDKFNTKNFKIVKIKGYYRLKFTGKQLPTLISLTRKMEVLTIEYDILYKYFIRHSKICYMSTKNIMWFHPQVYEDKNNKIYPSWKRFSKREIKKGKKNLFEYKKMLKSKKYKELKDEKKIRDIHYDYLANLCIYGELYQCIEYTINRCKKIGINTILIPFLINWKEGGGHHNMILIKNNKAWRIEHIYGHLPQLNDYMEKQFKKIGIKFQGYLYHIGNQTVCHNLGLCGYWSLYFAFYYGLNKKVGFDDMFHQKGKKPHEEMMLQMRIFLAYSLELLKKIKKEEKEKGKKNLFEYKKILDRNLKNKKDKERGKK